MNTLSMRSVQEIPKLFSNTREKDPVAYVRFMAAWRKTSWYVFEWDGEDTFFGYQVREGGSRHYGLFSLAQLARLESMYGSPVIQDYAFQPTRMSELRRQAKAVSTRRK